MGDWIVLPLLAGAGFLVGGAYSLWKTAKFMAVALALAALLAVAGAVVWLL